MLAKFANNVAKKQPTWSGVCDLTALSEPERIAVMGQFEVRDVWGIGRRIAMQLMEFGVRTVADLRACDPKRIRERFSVVVERTVNKLRGVACVAWESQPPARQKIIASRSFGGPLYTIEQLAAPIRFHMGRAAEKLRKQGSVAGALGVWLETNQFRPQDAQYSPAKNIPLPMPTDDTVALTAWATALLRAIYKPGYRYVKAGCMLMDLREREIMQGALFDIAPV
jgi:DNA polymerase V